MYASYAYSRFKHRKLKTTWQTPWKIGTEKFTRNTACHTIRVNATRILLCAMLGKMSGLIA
jgi:hypothetical protein